jgi:hypothetical protein
MPTFAKLYAQHQNDGERFQRSLGQFLIDAKHTTAFDFVETGCGISTLFILQAMDTIGAGHLYSIDPAPWFPSTIDHPRHTLIRKKSSEALLPLFQETGPWTYFLHDSNHDIECMTYELEVGHAMAEPLGYVFCDDTAWNNHHAWHNFCRRRSVSGSNMGSVEFMQKAYDEWPPAGPTEAVVIEAKAREFARQEHARFLAEGGKDSGVFGPV